MEIIQWNVKWMEVNTMIHSKSLWMKWTKTTKAKNWVKKIFNLNLEEENKEETLHKNNENDISKISINQSLCDKSKLSTKEKNGPKEIGILDKLSDYHIKLLQAIVKKHIKLTEAINNKVEEDNNEDLINRAEEEKLPKNGGNFNESLSSNKEIKVTEANILGK